MDAPKFSATIPRSRDDTPGATVARDLGFALARRLGGGVKGISVLDRAHATGSHEAVPVGGSAFAERRNQARAAAVAEEAAAVLAAARAAAATSRSRR